MRLSVIGESSIKIKHQTFNIKILPLPFMNLLKRPMIKYKTAEEIEIMRQAALVVSRTLGLIAAELRPGVTPLELDTMAEKYIRSQDAIPGFLGL